MGVDLHHVDPVFGSGWIGFEVGGWLASIVNRSKVVPYIPAARAAGKSL